MSVAWYQGIRRLMETASATSVCYHTGKPPVRSVGYSSATPCYSTNRLPCSAPTLSMHPHRSLPGRVRSIEVTFEESSPTTGVETQRQWSDLAILRATPALLGLFSWITLVTHSLFQTQAPPTQRAAWYQKPLPAFADALATGRHLLWFHPQTFCMSPSPPDVVKGPRPLFDPLVNSLFCYQLVQSRAKIVNGHE